MVLRMPSAEVLAAFGAGGEPVPLPGGQGLTWRAGNVVVKPSGLPGETAWRAEVLSSLPDSSDFRLARPVPAADRSWVVSGWEAWQVVAGEPDVRRWDEALRAGEAFHAALAGLPRPGFLDLRDDAWTYGERVAWDELPVDGHGVMAELLRRLAGARRPVQVPPQPVHGDLLGNVLFADGLPPAIIDWPVYFRPASWALAIVVVDGLTWYEAPPAIMNRWAARAEWGQMLLRALMYRIATNEGLRRANLPVRERATDYRPVVDLVLTRYGRHDYR